MRKTMAAIATVALASVAFGGSALAWGEEHEEHEEEGGKVSCQSGGVSGSNVGNTTGGGIANVLGPISALNGDLNGTSILSPNFCG